MDKEFRFFDEGDRGGTLLRPALEHLRNQAAAGMIDRLYKRAKILKRSRRGNRHAARSGSVNIL